MPWVTLHTSFNFKRSKVKVTRQINAVTKNQPYLQNRKAYELQTWYMDGSRRPALRCVMTSKLKVRVAVQVATCRGRYNVVAALQVARLLHFAMYGITKGYSAIMDFNNTINLLQFLPHLLHTYSSTTCASIVI